jgi:hypothetical protein
VAVAIVAGALVTGPAGAQACRVVTANYDVRISHTEERTRTHVAPPGSTNPAGDVTERIDRSFTFGGISVNYRKCKHGFKDIFIDGSGVDPSRRSNVISGTDGRTSTNTAAFPQFTGTCSWNFEVPVPDHVLHVTANIQKSRRFWNFSLRTSPTFDDDEAFEYSTKVSDGYEAACPDRGTEFASDASFRPGTSVGELAVQAPFIDYTSYDVVRPEVDHSKPPPGLRKLFKGENTTIDVPAWTFTTEAGGHGSAHVAFEFTRI